MIAYINNQAVQCEAGDTILAAAKRAGIYIPTLCQFMPMDHTPGTCRVCLVEVERNGTRDIVTSCNTQIEEGMKVFTRSPQVRSMQRKQVQWIFADHDQDCASCARHGDCELQDVARYVGLDSNPLNGTFKAERPIDCSANALVMDTSKCIRCGRCIEVCRQVQGVSALNFKNTGNRTSVGVAGADLWVDSAKCVQCGQCSLVCPVGAISEKNETETAIDWFNDPEIKTVVAFAPAVRVTLGEAFGFDIGANAEKRMITAIRKLGADYVCDVNWAADVTIMEEGTELIHRIKNHGTMPMMTSCCPGWINFVEKINPEVIPNLSTTRSPQAILGALAKTYFAQKKGIDPKKLKFISIMPCTAKKDEIKRDQLANNGMPDTDLVLTVREFAELLQIHAIDLAKCEESEFDSPVLSENTGAAVIFGATGGVMEAAVRTVHYVLTGREMDNIDLKSVRGFDWLKEAEIDLGAAGKVRIAVVHGLTNAQKIVDEIKAGTSPYHFIEVMACPGGCIDGGGTMRVKNNYLSRFDERMQGLYTIDTKRKLRQSHLNPDVQTLYKEFLKEPNGELSHHLLHTGYKDRRSEKKVISIEALRSEIELA